jgi:TP901 family phage tail tape measure protein
VPDVAQLGLSIVADDRASKTLEDVESRLRLTERAFDGLSVTTVAKGGLVVGALLAVGTAAAKMAEQGVRAAADLEHSVANISTIKPDVDTSAVFKSLNNLQTQVPQTAKQLGDSLYDVFSSIDNVTQEQGLKLVETFAKGATAAQTDAKTFGTAISGVLNAYKLDTADAAKVSDIFFNTVNRGVVTGPQLAAGLGPAIAAGKQLGITYQETFALIVGATKEGGDAAQNINNITNLLSKLPTPEATADLNALGIATQTAAGALRTPVEVLTDLKAKLDGMTEAARATTLLKIFPDLQARQGAQVIMSQLDTVNAALGENRTQTNSTAEAYAKMSATAIEQGKLLQNTWSALLTDLSVVALPALVGALGVAGAAVREFREDFEAAKPPVEAAATAVQTKSAEIQRDLDTLTTYTSNTLGPQWDAFWRKASGADYPMRALPAPPAPTEAQQAAAGAFGPVTPATTYVPGTQPASIEQTRSPFGGAGAGHLSPEEAGLGPLGNIRGQFENVLEDMAESNARHAAAMADTLAEDYGMQLLRRKPMLHDAGAELGEAVGEGLAGGVAAAEPVARSAALVARDLDEARTREHEAALGGAVAVREHAEALEQERIANLGGAVAIRDHADALARQHEEALGGALALRDHAEALEREHVANLGGAVAIRDHEEALTREKDAALGGALAIRDHQEALTREHDAALGGALAMRDHAEALKAEQEAALGGAKAIWEHQQALEAQNRAASVASGLASEQIAQLEGQALATAQYTERIKGLTAEQRAHYDAVRQVLGAEEALRQLQAAPSTASTSAASRFGVGVGVGVDLTAQAPSIGAAMARGFRENVGSGPEEFGREVAGGFSPYAKEALKGTFYGVTPEGLFGATWNTMLNPLGGHGLLGDVTDEARDFGTTAAAHFTNEIQPAFSTGAVLFSTTLHQSAEEWRAQLQAASGQLGVTLTQAAQQQARQAAGVGGGDYGLGPVLNTLLAARPELTQYASAPGYEGALAAGGSTYARGNWLDYIGRVAQQQIATENLAGAAQAKGYGPSAAEMAYQVPFTNPETGQDVMLTYYRNAVNQATDAAKGFAEGVGYAGGLSVEQANAMDKAAHEGAVKFATFTAGTGLAAQTVYDFQGELAVTSAQMRDIQIALNEEQAKMRWAASQATAAALQAGQMLNAGVAGGRTATGLTTTQIYGGTATSGGSLSGTGFTPTSVYGIPILSPLTPGTLLGHAGGGTVAEPSYLVSMRNGRAWGSIAERGPEQVVPAGGGASAVNITVYAGMGAGDVLQDRGFWERAWRDQIRPAANMHGAAL